MKIVQTGQWPVNWQLAFAPWTAIMKIYMLTVVCIRFFIISESADLQWGKGAGKGGYASKIG